MCIPVTARWLVTALLLAALVSSASGAEDPYQKERIAVLVEMLASKNRAPKGGPTLKYPRKYDKKAQAVVYLAIQQLLSEGSAAFDTLIAHFKDKRYSYSIAAPSGDFNVSVGEACLRIMRRVIECYRGEISLISKDQHYMYLSRKGKPLDLAKWWKNNKHRPLWEIQVDALDHALKFMKSAKLEKGSRFEALREKNIEWLKAKRDAIALSKELYRPKSLDNYHRHYIIMLPWGSEGGGSGR